jgi:hypothetical protein
VSLHFGQITDIADVITFAVLIHMFVLHFSSAEIFDSLECFENRAAVGAAPTDVIDLSAARILIKGLDEPGDVQRMNDSWMPSVGQAYRSLRDDRAALAPALPTPFGFKLAGNVRSNVYTG